MLKVQNGRAVKQCINDKEKGKWNVIIMNMFICIELYDTQIPHHSLNDMYKLHKNKKKLY